MSLRLLRRAIALPLVGGLVACSSEQGQGPEAGEPQPVCPSIAPEVEPGPGDLPVATWAREAIVYHVLVRSFADSGGDGHGDFDGLVGRLDHLVELGVTAILMLPTTDSAYDWAGGYSLSNHCATESDYGDLASFDALVAATHERGLKLLMDLTLAIAADAHPYFEDASTSRDARYHDYFVWEDLVGGQCPQAGLSDPNTGELAWPYWHPVPALGQCYWTTWGAFHPEWNYKNPAVRAMIFDAVAFWQDRGVDGFRLDAVAGLDDEVLEGEPRSHSEGTHQVVRELMARMKAKDPEALAIAEVYTTDQGKVTPYYDDGVDMAFDYPVYGAIVSALTGGDVATLGDAVDAKLASLPADHMGGLFLGNHDVPREQGGLAGKTVGRLADQLEHDPARLVQAAVLLMSLPGTPFVFFGEEIGLPGAPGPDKSEFGIPYDPTVLWGRNPMQWDGSVGSGFTTGTPWVALSDASDIHVAAQEAEQTSLLTIYRYLIALRKQIPALTDGSYVRLTSAEPAIYAALREGGAQRIAVVFNFDGVESKDAAINLEQVGITQAQVYNVFDGSAEAPVTAANASAYGTQEPLPPYAFRWLLLE